MQSEKEMGYLGKYLSMRDQEESYFFEHKMIDNNLLFQFLSETDQIEIERLASQLESEYSYLALVAPHSDTVSVEAITPLEIAAAKGKLEHVNALLKLHANPTSVRLLRKLSKNPADISAEQPMSQGYQAECAACFRAIEQGQTEVVLRLLNQPAVSSALLDTQIVGPRASDQQKDYMQQLQSHSHYPIRNNRVPARGNVALVLAAGLPNAEIFNTLLKIDALKKQLPESGIVAFLMATRNSDGSTKNPINKEIVNQLLNIPIVYNYASTRPFDFGELITDFDATKTTKYYQTQISELKQQDDASAELTDEETCSIAPEESQANSIKSVPSQDSLSDVGRDSPNLNS